MIDNRERNYSLDIIRIVATFFVVAVHFFLHTGFYSQPVDGKRMFLMVGMRTLFMACIPLFLMLTGYLMNKKKLSLKYFKGIVKTLSIYILASLSCMIFKNIYLDHPLTLKHIIKSLVTFQGANYSWYIELYIGLFIIIPFLNLIYNGLETKKQKQISLLGLILIVTVPPMIQKTSAGIESLANIGIPTWTYLYPIMYYFIGAYICEYKPQMKKGLNSIVAVATIILSGMYYFFINKGQTFAWGDYQDSCSFPIMVMSVLLFIWFNNLNLSRIKDSTKRILKHVSEITLGAYLMSYIFDEMIYTTLREMVPDMLNRVYYFPATTILVFIGALFASELLNLIYKGLCVIVNKIKNVMMKCE